MKGISCEPATSRDTVVVNAESGPLLHQVPALPVTYEV